MIIGMHFLLTSFYYDMKILADDLFIEDNAIFTFFSRVWI